LQVIRIHNFARGARGVRLFWQCEEMGLAYERVVVTYPPGDAYLALNPLGSVPLLEDEGVAIGESIAIMLHLARRYGPTPLLPPAHDPRSAEALSLTVFGETAIGMGLNPLLAAHFGAPEADKRNWSVRGGHALPEPLVAYRARLAERPAYQRAQAAEPPPPARR
jgi:glutathione S-transferase